MAQRMTDASVKHRLFSVQAKIIEIDVPSLGRGQWPDGVYPPGGYARIGRRVEKTGPIQKRLRGERAHVPRSLFPYESDSIECQTNIGSFSRIHKPACAEKELLPPEPHDEGILFLFRPLRQCDIRERLLEPELGFVNDRPRTAISSLFEIARELHKEPNSTAHMKVAIRHEPLQEIAVAILWAHAPQGIAKSFVPLTRFTADCQKAIAARSEPHIFQRVPAIPLAGGIAKVAVILVLPEHLIFRWIGACRLSLQPNPARIP